MSSKESVIGLLLAGGKSSRMGGGAKSLRLLGGRPIIARVIERLSPQVFGVVTNANGDKSRLAAYQVPVVVDCIASFAGLHAGIHAGLKRIKANRSGISHAVTVATDTLWSLSR